MSFGTDLRAAQMEIVQETGGAQVQLVQPSGTVTVWASPPFGDGKVQGSSSLNVSRTAQMVIPGGQDATPTTGDKIVEGSVEWAVNGVSTARANGIDVAYTLTIAEIGT